MFLIIVAVNEIGNYIENNPTNYSCPDYCGINHKHVNIKNKEYYEYTRSDSGVFVWESRDERQDDRSSE
jgi:hypothetical protein